MSSPVVQKIAEELFFYMETVAKYELFGTATRLDTCIAYRRLLTGSVSTFRQDASVNTKVARRLEDLFFRHPLYLWKTLDMRKPTFISENALPWSLKDLSNALNHYLYPPPMYSLADGIPYSFPLPSRTVSPLLSGAMEL